jgi:SAM-dependent methyltransferase
VNRAPADLAALLARPHRRIVLDLGCGDARATARLAAAEPDWIIVGADANLDAAQRVIKRARRAPEKGGLPNLAIVKASADALPHELDGHVDELRIELPWGSLLEALVDSGEQRPMDFGLARLLAAGGSVRIVLNARALPHGLSREDAAARLREGLRSAGLVDLTVASTAIDPATGWGKRLAAGRPLEVIVAEARRA